MQIPLARTAIRRKKPRRRRRIFFQWNNTQSSLQHLDWYLRKRRHEIKKVAVPVVSYPEAQSCTTLNLEMLDCCFTSGLLLWQNSNREFAYRGKVGLCTLFCGFLSFVGRFPKKNFEYVSCSCLFVCFCRLL